MTQEYTPQTCSKCNKETIDFFVVGDNIENYEIVCKDCESKETIDSKTKTYVVLHRKNDDTWQEDTEVIAVCSSQEIAEEIRQKYIDDTMDEDLEEEDKEQFKEDVDIEIFELNKY